jgi:beta-glucosidase
VFKLQGFGDDQHLTTTTAWPSSLTMAASWDVKAMNQWANGMGEEFWAKGASMQLGPGVNLARVPHNGRNFEYISGEDPFLGFTLVQPVVRGIQGNGIMAVAKHFICNNQEFNRREISANVDERTRFEFYYAPFEGAIRAGVASISTTNHDFISKIDFCFAHVLIFA